MAYLFSKTRPKGKMLFTPFSTEDTDYSALDGTGGLRWQERKGTVRDVGLVCYYSEEDIHRVAHYSGFEVESISHHKRERHTAGSRVVSAYWEVVFRKP